MDANLTVDVADAWLTQDRVEYWVALLDARSRCIGFRAVAAHHLPATIFNVFDRVPHLPSRSILDGGSLDGIRAIYLNSLVLGIVPVNLTHFVGKTACCWRRGAGVGNCGVGSVVSNFARQHTKGVAAMGNSIKHSLPDELSGFFVANLAGNLG